MSKRLSLDYNFCINHFQCFPNFPVTRSTETTSAERKLERGGGQFLQSERLHEEPRRPPWDLWFCSSSPLPGGRLENIEEGLSATRLFHWVGSTSGSTTRKEETCKVGWWVCRGCEWPEARAPDLGGRRLGSVTKQASVVPPGVGHTPRGEVPVSAPGHEGATMLDFWEANNYHEVGMRLRPDKARALRRLCSCSRKEVEKLVVLKSRRHLLC